MKKHWKKLTILALVIAVVAMFSLPGAVFAQDDVRGISLTKEAYPSTIVQGEESIIDYIYTVTNTGSCALGFVTLTDSELGVIDLFSTDLSVGESITGFVSVEMTPSSLDPIVNVATVQAIGMDPFQEYPTEYIEATATCSVTVVLPEGEPGEPGEPGATGEKGAAGAEGSTGSSGSRGPRGRSGKDVVRMFSTDGGDTDPWSLTSESADKYMLESTTAAGKTTHIIVEIIFMVEQADGSLVFMAK